LIFGEALAKGHVFNDLRLSRNEAKNQKDRFPQGRERSAAYLMEML